MSRYANFVLAVSGELSAVAERDVDASIERALGRVAMLSGADRAYVFLRSEDGQRVTNTHEWCALGVVPAKHELSDLPLDRFPWAFRMLDGAEELIVPRVSDSPPGPERIEWEKEAIRTLFCTPLVVHGACVGFIGCDWVKREDPLDSETVQMVRVAASLIAGAVSRRRAWRHIDSRRRFDELALRISTRFVSLPGEELPKAFDGALEQLCRFIGVESGLVARWGEDGRIRAQHLWRIPPLSMPDPAEWAEVDPSTLALLMNDLKAGGAVSAASLEEGARYAPVRAFLARHGVQALFVAPLVVAGQPWGFLGFSSARPRSWSDDEQQMLQIAAQLFSNALTRVEADRNEQRLQHQLRQTQKLDVVGQLAGGVAHDFNNLLVSITLWSELARRNLERSPPEAAEAIEEISRAAARAATLTQQLLAFSRQRPVNVRPLALSALVGDMFKMLRRLVRESIRIELTLQPTSAQVQADPAQLEQVLLNLCVNASDAMPEGGTLTIHTYEAELPAAPGLPPWVTPGPHQVLTVTDTGVGISPELADRIFEPFFTTKAPGKGTGLGLSTVYGIVRQHHGLVRVESQPGCTRFEVWLPTLQEPIAARPSAPLPTASGGTETVLLAEDDVLVRSAITEVLTQAGYRVLAAADGTKAVELFDKEPTIAVALLDAVMPGLSGLETWRSLQQRRADLPVLFISGYSHSVFPPGFFDDGQQQLLAKPFQPALLLSRLRELLDNRKSVPPAPPG